MDFREEKHLIWNPYAAGYFDNPHQYLSVYQQYNPIQKGIHQQWMIFEYGLVKEILRSEDFKVSNLSSFFKKKENVIFQKTNQCPFLAKGTDKWLMYLDDEEHKVARLLGEKALKSFDLEKLLTEKIQAWIHQKQNTPIIDLVEFAADMVIVITNAILGIPESVDTQKCKEVSHALAVSQDLFVPIQKYREINVEMEWIFSVFTDVCEQKRKNPDETFASKIIEINENEQLGFEKDELVSLLIIMFMGAIETTKDALSVIFYEWLQNPNLLDTVIQANSKQVNILVEEFLRYASPLQFTIRVPRKDFQIHNYLIPAESQIYLCLASANRDPQIFSEAHSIHPNRTQNPHIAFGSGTHTCIGGKLARIELRTLIPLIAPILKQYQLVPDHLPQWQNTIMMRGLKSLPVMSK